MSRHEKINYVEYPSRDLPETKRFFERAFGWTFQDYGPDYAAFSDQGLDGGFFKSGLAARTETGSALIVLYSEDLFPGGRRFHFVEPGGNELAVWSEPEA